MRDLHLRDKISNEEQRQNFEILRDAVENIEQNWLQKIYNPIYWDDQQVGISNVRLPAANAPTWTSYKGSQVLAFDPAQDNYIYFSAQLTHAYEEGTDIEFHMHVAHPDANSGNSQWHFSYSWATPGEAFPTEVVEDVLHAAPGTADLNEYLDFADEIPGTGKGISSILLCSLYREGTAVADTYANDIYLVGLDFHLKKNSPGSLQETSK